ncbi:hypothetical protein C8R44DRAFT_883748 [Mycena epipterygia]|nr:hypothetical protein C8R44DRAFT_883748 [Mycena epipterygia]
MLGRRLIPRLGLPFSKRFPNAFLTTAPQSSRLCRFCCFPSESISQTPKTPQRNQAILPRKPFASEAERDKIIATFPVFPERVLPYTYTCQWHSWSCISFFFVPREWYDRSVADVLLTQSFSIRGALRPLAFSDFDDPVVLFGAGADYYLWNGASLALTRFGSNFASDEDFLSRLAVVPIRPGFEELGITEDLAADYPELCCRVDWEQRTLVWEKDGIILPQTKYKNLLDPAAERAARTM